MSKLNGKLNGLAKKPLAIALGAAFALSSFGAQASVFQAADLGSGYMVAADEKAGEQKCGEKKAGEAKCGEKKTAAAKAGEKHGSNCDAKAGVDQKTGECMCGAAKGKMADGKCGEGKCGGKKKK